MSAAQPPATAGLVLLHGTPLTPAQWDGVRAALPRGPVEHPPTPVLTPRVELVDDHDRIVDRIAAALPAASDPWHVVGHSFGGQLAIDLALDLPERVGRLTLISTRDTPFPAFAAAAARLRSGVPPDVQGALTRWFTQSELASGDPLVDYARRCLVEIDPLRWARALESIASCDRSGRTPRIAVPVHVVAAELDQVSTPAAMTEMAARIPGSRFTMLPGAAHMSPFLEPVGLATLIEAGIGTRISPGGHSRSER